MLGAILGRAEAQVLRLALIYALLDGSAFIDEPHMLAALACWDYAEASARFVFGDASAIRWPTRSCARCASGRKA